jgi:hypothetical protein
MTSPHIPDVGSDNHRFNLKKKYKVIDGKVYHVSDKGVVEKHPLLATEEWYAVLAQIHHEKGHLTRDGVYAELGKRGHDGIAKALVSDYVAQCCRVGLAKNRKRFEEAAERARQELAELEKNGEGAQMPKRRKRDAREMDAGMETPEAKRSRMSEAEVRD